jgi:hypothetical protein
MNRERMQSSEPDVETLQLIYARLILERDRLRDARRAVTAQLGPLPAAGAVVLGLFTGLPDDIQNRGLVWAALALFIGVLALSAWGIGLDPYRLRGGEVDAPTMEDGLRDDDFLSREEWLFARIKHERRVYYGTTIGGAQPSQSEPLSLQAGFERERSTLTVVQVLLAIEVIVLVAARLLPG